MNNEEAMGILSECMVRGVITREAENYAFWEVMMNALDKQIPRKPKIIEHWHMCPTCYDKYGFSYDILIGMKGLKTSEYHCLNCGQAIDWSDYGT